MDAAVFLPGEKPRALQDPEVLGDRRKRHGEGLGQRRHRGFSARQPGEDRPAGRVRQGRKSGVEGASLILNHMVKYKTQTTPLSSTKFEGEKAVR